MNFVLTPQPVNCQSCGYLLKASYAAQNMGCCPSCGEPACYTCGCVAAFACVKALRTNDGARSLMHACAWAEMGLCSFCFDEAAYVLYMEATGRVPTDPYYLRTYRAGETHHVTPEGIVRP